GAQLIHGHVTRVGGDISADDRRSSQLRRIVKHADRLIALSAFQQEMFVRNGYAREKIQVLTHGLETAGLKPACFDGVEEVIVVFIGSLVYHKGPHILLKALALHPSCKVRLLLYGDASG